MNDVIALDVSKGHSYVVWYVDEHPRVEFECLHTQVGFSQLLDVIKITENPIIYFEATGIYSRPIEKFCQDNNFQYCMLNPLQVYLATTELRRLKTDKSDAHKIALSTYQSEYRLTTVWSTKYKDLRERSRFIDMLDKDISYKRNQFETLIQQTFPEIEGLFANQFSKLALNIVELFPHPDCIKGLSRTKIKNILMNQTDKKLSKVKGYKYADKLIAYAQNSYPSVDASSITIDEVKYICRALKNLIKKRDEQIKLLKQLASSLQEFDILTSIPGIGEQTAAQVISELGDIRRFRNNNQINAYVGIDINRYQSGKYTRTDHINKRGNPRLRKLLFFAVKNMVRAQAHADNHIVDYYYRLKNGPSHKRDKVATVACINKTIKCMFSMVQANHEYDYSSHHGLKVQIG